MSTEIKDHRGRFTIERAEVVVGASPVKGSTLRARLDDAPLLGVEPGHVIEVRVYRRPRNGILAWLLTLFGERVTVDIDHLTPPLEPKP